MIRDPERLLGLGALLLVGSAAVAAVGTASAQPDGGAVGDSPGATVPEVPMAQMLPRAHEQQRQAAASAAQVRRQLEEARAVRDVIKLLCLDDKVRQLDVAVESARDRAGVLEAAVGKGDGELAQHAFAVLTVLHERVAALVAEASQCIGEEEGFIGDGYVKMEIDPRIPEDPSALLDDPMLSAPPLISSPIQ